MLNIINSEQINETEYNFNGDLTIKGITHSIEFIGTVNKEHDFFYSYINLEFDRTQWDIKYNSGSFFDGLGNYLILDEIEFDISLLSAR